MRPVKTVIHERQNEWVGRDKLGRR